MKIILLISGIFFSLYILFIIFLYLYQGKLVYLPPVLTQEELASLKSYQAIEAQTSDGLKLKGYFLKPQTGQPVIIVFHGNASHSARKIEKFHDWSKRGYGFLLAEYRGYDGNPGSPNEKGLYQDGEAFFQWAENNPDLKGHPIIIYGESLGSGVAVDVGSHHQIAALVLEVTFSSLAEVGAWHYPYILFSNKIMNNRYPNIDKIKNVKAPILFLLAGHDEVVGTRFGKKLADAANQLKEVHIFENARHDNVYEYGAAAVVKKFLERYVP